MAGSVVLVSMLLVLLAFPLLLLTACRLLLAAALRRVRPAARRARAATAAWAAVTAAGALAVLIAQWSELAPRDRGAGWVGLGALGVLVLPALASVLVFRAHCPADFRAVPLVAGLGAAIAIAGSAAAALLWMFAHAPGGWIRSQLVIQALPTSYAACALAVRTAARHARQTEHGA